MSLHSSFSIVGALLCLITGENGLPAELWLAIKRQSLTTVDNSRTFSNAWKPEVAAADLVK